MKIPVAPSVLGQFVFCERLSWLRKHKTLHDHPRMARGRDLHKGWTKFNEAWVFEIQAYRRIKLNQFERFLKAKQNQIISKEFKDRAIKRALEALLNNYSSFLVEKASTLLTNTKFVIQEFLNEFFGGLNIHFEYKVNFPSFSFQVDAIGFNEESFTVFELKTGSTPTQVPPSHVMQVASAGVYLEKKLKKKCHELVVIYPEKVKRFKLTNQLKQQVHYEQDSYNTVIQLHSPPSVQPENPCKVCTQKKVCQQSVPNNTDDTLNIQSSSCSSQSPNIGNSPLPTYLGVIIQNKKYTSTLHAKKENTIYGKLKEEYVEVVRAGDLVIIEKEKESLQVYCEVLESQTYPSTAATGGFKSTGEVVTNITLNPFLELTFYDDQIRREEPRQRDYSEFRIRKADPKEIALSNNLRTEGIPLGILASEGSTFFDHLHDNAVPYRFPLDEENQGYKGIFFTGSPGKGKTSMTALFVCGAAKYMAEGSPPAILIIDIEGAYTRLNEPSQGSAFDQEFWQMYGLSPVSDLKVYQISDSPNESSHKLDFLELSPKGLSLMYPMLPGKSCLQFERIAKEIKQKYSYSSFDQFKRTFSHILSKFPELHESQADAITRALESNLIDSFFDSKGQIIDMKALLSPGTISVIDCSGITDVEVKRIIALYFFIVLRKYKLDLRNKNKLLMIFDEAHEIFPRSTSGEQETSYINRVVNEIRSVVRLGRKRHYGLVFDSQLPMDISTDIINLCQTKIILGLENDSWVDSVLGPKYKRKVSKFKKGDALIHCVDFHEYPVHLRVPKAPCKHEARK